MNNPLSKTPFLFLLIPLVLGILLQYYSENILWSIIFSLIGGLLMLFSFFINRDNQYSFRWIFGFGVFLLFCFLGSGATYVQQQKLNYILSDSVQVYKGYVTNTPQKKPRSIAHKVYLEKEGINIVCYLQKDSTKRSLAVGDEIIFMAQLEAFKNAGNPDNFDYKRYMYNQGFVASTYLSSASWAVTGNSHKSVTIIALQVRQKVMDFYSSLSFTEDEHSILSALTLGYQDTLSDDLKQGFRTTGTVHVLSVSGLHVGIIYAMISFLLSFISRTSRFYRIRPLLIILLLWCYAFITGLPPSVIRASVMLSVFCVSELFLKRSSSLNALYIAGFAMLLFNPFWLFDIGFQLSFISVLAILLLHPKMIGLVTIKNKILNTVWQMFALSVVAQLATFPLCLYYFGTFPTYFFVANLLVVPLVTFIIYGVGLIILAWGVATMFPLYSNYIYWLPSSIVKTLVQVLTKFVELFENLPFALIQNVNLSFIELILLVFIIIGMLFARIKSSSKILIASLLLTILLLSFHLVDALQTKENKLIVYNRNGYSDILIHQNGTKYSVDSLISSNRDNPVLELDGKKVLFINVEPNGKLYSEQLFDVDHAIIIGEAEYSLFTLEQFYNIRTLVLDSSLSTHVHRRLTKECENRNILLYDVTQKGAFSIIF